MSDDDLIGQACDLIDAKACTAECLFGAKRTCNCRCDGAYHGLLRGDRRPTRRHKHPGWDDLGWLMWRDCNLCGAASFDAVDSTFIRQWKVKRWLAEF